jgi:hypothetical protein
MTHGLTVYPDFSSSESCNPSNVTVGNLSEFQRMLMITVPLPLTIDLNLSINYTRRITSSRAADNKKYRPLIVASVFAECSRASPERADAYRGLIRIIGLPGGRMCRKKQTYLSMALVYWYFSRLFFGDIRTYMTMQDVTGLLTRPPSHESVEPLTPASSWLELCLACRVECLMTCAHLSRSGSIWCQENSLIYR